MVRNFLPIVLTVLSGVVLGVGCEKEKATEPQKERKEIGWVDAVWEIPEYDYRQVVTSLLLGDTLKVSAELNVGSIIGYIGVGDTSQDEAMKEAMDVSSVNWTLRIPYSSADYGLVVFNADTDSIKVQVKAFAIRWE